MSQTEARPDHARATETRATETRTTAELIADCVHCGFCLPACPTYRSWGNEPDSPRGRIDLMKGLEEGTLPFDDSVVEHIDACLGCLACVPACPSGVRYDLLIESTRAKIEENYPRSPADRAFRELIFSVMPYPRRLAALSVPLLLYVRSGLQRVVRSSKVLDRLFARFAALEALIPQVSFTSVSGAPPRDVAAKGALRGRVALIAGCVQRAFFPNVNAATLRVFAAEGFDVVVPRGQGCCGALSLHSGRADEARRFARALIECFEQHWVEAFIVNAAGCGSVLKQYGELFADDPAWRERAERFAERVVDVNEFLARYEPVAPRQPMPMRVAYHDACHLAHGQRVREQPRALLRTIPQLELVEIPDGDQCCGSAGVYNLLEPQSAREIGERKVDNIESVAPDMLASPNPGCTLQVTSLLRKRGKTLLAAHPMEILDAAIERV